MDFGVGMTTMSAMPLERQAERCLEVSVGWEGMLTARLINNNDLTNMRRVAGKRFEVLAGMLRQEDGEAYCGTMLTVLRYVTAHLSSFFFDRW